MDCPKCGFASPDGAAECVACGVVFAKVTRRHTEPEIDPWVLEEERIADGRIGLVELKVLGIGLAAAVVVYVLPFSRFVFSALITLFHELGHAVAGWLLGYPSLPAFDFVYGGGFTHHGPFRLSIALAVGAALAYLGWMFRQNRMSLAIAVAILAIWVVVVTKEWRREIAFASAGHVAEVVLAGILFYKALAGVGWRVPLVERPLGAFVAFFVQIHSMMFAWRLTHDSAFLHWYREGKGGALMNDLEVVALDLQIWLGIAPGIEGVARGLLFFSLLPFGVALVWYLERARWHRVLRALKTVDG